MKSRGALLVVSLLVSLLLAEVVFRLAAPALGVDAARLAAFRDFVATGGETAQYEARPHLLYVRRVGLPGVNSLGYQEVEPSRIKAPGTTRIVCLGSSTTEGGNPEGRAGSYPHFLGELLKARGSQVEVLNFAVSGWTTAEILVSYLLVVQDYAPDVVLIHEAANDVEPRAWPGFQPDYSHYRRPWREPRFSLPYRLAVRGSTLFAYLALGDATSFGIQAAVVKPPAGPLDTEGDRLKPKTAEAYRRNLRSLLQHVAAGKARAMLLTLPYDGDRAGKFPLYRHGIDEHNAIARELAREEGATLVDLAALGEADQARLRPAFLDLVHLAPDGNRWKAEQVAAALTAQGLP